MTPVTVVSYGAGNVASVQFALERLGAVVRLTADPAEVAAAERLILPGVGAAGYGCASGSNCCSRPARKAAASPCLA